MLDREEYIEQSHLFRILSERISENLPVQEVLQQARDEILSIAKLPLAIDYMVSELKHSGSFAPAMARLKHYFTPFQTYLVQEAESERGRFDMRVALEVLRAEAAYRAESLRTQGIFMFQFETLCRNRLRYDRGLQAMSEDPVYDESWRDWILTVRRQIGIIDFANLLYVRSEFYWQRQRGTEAVPDPSKPVLFGEKEGKIAYANRQKDPLYLFAALQRHLGYPTVPRTKRPDETQQILPQLMRRMERLESRIKLLEDEQRGGFDLSKFYERPDLPKYP